MPVLSLTVLPYWSLIPIAVVIYLFALLCVLLYDRFAKWSTLDGRILVSMAALILPFMAVALFFRFS